MKVELLEQVRILRLERKLSVAGIQRELKIKSKSTAFAYVNRVEAELTPTARQELRLEIAKTPIPEDRFDLNNEVRRLRLRIAELENLLEHRLKKVYAKTPFEKGYVGELLVHYYLARNGINFYLPPFTIPACDLLIVNQSGKPFRCEIKATDLDHITFRRTYYSRDMAKNTSILYAESDNVDVFIAVDLQTEAIYFIPNEVVLARSSFSLKNDEQIRPYKDNLSIFDDTSNL